MLRHITRRYVMRSGFRHERGAGAPRPLPDQLAEIEVDGEVSASRSRSGSSRRRRRGARLCSRGSPGTHVCNHGVAPRDGGRNMASDRIEREIIINAPQDRVWAALTEADHVAQWFGDSAEVDLRPGGKMVFGWKEHGNHHALVERVEPPGF